MKPPWQLAHLKNDYGKGFHIADKNKMIVI